MKISAKLTKMVKNKLGVVPEPKTTFTQLFQVTTTQYKNLAEASATRHYQQNTQTKPEENIANDSKDPWQAFKHQLPAITKQFLGKNYPLAKKMSQRFLPPEQLENMVERIFEQTALLSAKLSQVKAIQKRRLALPVGPNSRQAYIAMNKLAMQIATENKTIASVEGAITGMMGLTGAAIDVPVMVMLALRTIYQTAACYGVELEEEQGVALALEVLADVDLNLYAQKQVILLALAQAKTMLQDVDIQRFYDWAGQNTDVKRIQKFVSMLEGRITDRFKPKYIAMRYVTPIAAASIAGVYNSIIITKVAEQAQQKFKPSDVTNVLKLPRKTA